MNKQLIKFIELCLMDGVITDKEREVIFRKSKELGVPDDECEIILEGMVQKSEITNEIDIQVVNGNKNNYDIESIYSLDKDLIISFSNYLKILSEKLEGIYSPKFLNQVFRRWYKNLGSHLTIQKSNLSWRGNVVFVNSGENSYEWDNVEMVNDNIQFDFLKDSEVILTRTTEPRDSSDIYTMYSNLNFYDFKIIEHKKFLGSNYFSWNFIKSTPIEDIDITDFKSSILKKHFTIFSIFFSSGLMEDETFDDYTTHLKTKFSSNSSNEIVKQLPNHNIFGDELVIKLTNHIDNLINGLNTQLNSVTKYDMIPLFYSKIDNGFCSKPQTLLDYIVYSIKNISNLISMRDHLLYFVLTENRSSILMIKEQMDDQGILLTHYQKEKLDKLEEIVNTLKKGFKMLSGTLMNLSSQLEKINTSIDDGNQQIKERLEFNNLVTGIQTYQLYKINKNT